jgi:hypothetical protein
MGMFLASVVVLNAGRGVEYGSPVGVSLGGIEANVFSDGGKTWV